MKKTLFVLLTLLVAIGFPCIGGSNSNEIVIWEIGIPHGNVHPITGAGEYPSNEEFNLIFDYDLDSDSYPTVNPQMPGYIGPENVCEFTNDERPCTDTAQVLNINFTIDSNDAGRLTFFYDRYGSDRDILLFDGEEFATVSGSEGAFMQFSFNLGFVQPGEHTITIAYDGGGAENGHYIDYLKLVLVSARVDIAVDIKPTSCPNPLNIKSKGILPVAILGTNEFDVTQVASDTVRLEGVAPVRWALEDVASPFEPFQNKGDCFADCNEVGVDGFVDLTLKFDTQELVSALGNIEDGECHVLTLTGDLKPEYGVVPIEGEDVVLILRKGKEEESKKAKKNR